MTDFTYVLVAESVGFRYAEGHGSATAAGRGCALLLDLGPYRSEAVFIDSLLNVPALAGRQLFVGLDIARDPGLDLGTLHNGWLISANTFLTGLSWLIRPSWRCVSAWRRSC